MLDHRIGNKLYVTLYPHMVRVWIALFWLFLLGSFGSFGSFGLGSVAHAAEAAQTSKVSHFGGVSVRYCANNEKELTLAQAKQCDYVSYENSAPSDSGTTVRWIKIQAETSRLSQTLTINVGPYLIRDIRLFSENSADPIAGPVGTAYPYSPEHGQLVGYAFSVEPDHVGLNTYYLRIVPFSLPYAFAQATLDPLTAQNLNQQVGLGVHLGVLGLLVLISAGVYAFTRTAIMGVFLLVILNLLLSSLAGSGFLAQYIWPNSPRFNEWFFSTMFCLRPGLWVWLAQTFLAPYQTPAWYRPSCRIAYLIVAAMVVFVLLGLNQISSLLVLIFGVIVFPIAQIIAITKTHLIRSVYQRILITGYAVGTLGIWIGLLAIAYPTDNPQLPIQIARLIDYANPVVLLGLVMFHYRETILQLAATQQENVAIKLGLELEQKLKEERKLMVDMLTHELKNPLASISLASGSLATSIENNNELTKRRLSNIEQSVRSMDAVIERCNIMNQLDQSTLAPNLSCISIKEIMSNIIARFNDGQRVKVTIESHDTFATDPQFFEMIVSNLVDNALKYSPTNSDVHVSYKHETSGDINELVMTVTNQIGSEGVPDKNLVFARFYRHQFAHRTSGSGVGLYLTRALATLMGGRITYHPNNHQVRFCVRLPEKSFHD